MDIPGKDTKTERSAAASSLRCIKIFARLNLIGTYDSGLIHFDSNSNLFTIYQHVDNRPTSISSNRVKAITEAKGMICGSALSRTGLVQTGERLLKSFTHDDDNPTSIIYDLVNALMTDAAGSRIGTDNGLTLSAKDGTRFIHYQNDPSFSEKFGAVMSSPRSMQHLARCFGLNVRRRRQQI
ncbi:MAG: hypothetical protein U0V48_00095 [Anaerolineales bacterium]